MITILVVGGPQAETDPSGYAIGHPSVEILSAAGVEDALEKLARNRRIDAVLLLPGSEAAELAAVLSEEDPSAPPLFAPEAAGTIPGTTRLPDGDPNQLLERMVARLEPRS